VTFQTTELHSPPGHHTVFAERLMKSEPVTISTMFVFTLVKKKRDQKVSHWYCHGAYPVPHNHASWGSCPLLCDLTSLGDEWWLLLTSLNSL